MKILAFDTSSSTCTVALQVGNHAMFLHQMAPMQQAHLVLPMIHELLATASLTVNQLDAIAYGSGPGSFTGIRIASSVAQGIGFAANLPIIQISSLAAMAQTAFIQQHKTKCLVVLDARMGQVYWGAYQVNPYGRAELVGKEQVGQPEELHIAETLLNNELTNETLNSETWCGIGDGWEKYDKPLIARLGFKPSEMDSSLIPHASAMLPLAIEKFKQKDWITPSQTVPDYLR